MNPRALERAFEIYPEVQLVVAAHLYGFPGKADEIRAVCDAHGALLIEGIRGDYYSVMGLPVAPLGVMLRKLNAAR